MTKPITELKAIAERAKDAARGPLRVGNWDRLTLAWLKSSGGAPLATHIATFDPPTVLSLLAIIEDLKEALARVRSNASIPHRVKQICDEALTQNQE